MHLVKGVVLLGLKGVLGLFLYWNLSPAPDCDLPPQVNNAIATTHETGSMFTVGSQVNYSCGEGCGHFSLTCRVQDHVATWPVVPTHVCSGENAYLVLLQYFTRVCGNADTWRGFVAPYRQLVRTLQNVYGYSNQ